MKSERLAKVKFYGLIAFFVISFAFSLYLKKNDFGFMDIKNIGDLKYAPLFYILFYVTTSFVPLPFSPHAVIGALLFNWYNAFFYTFIGSTIFTSLMFFITRLLAKDYVKLISKKYKNLRKYQIKEEKNYFNDILMLRMFYLIPSEFVSIISGLSNVKFKKYFLATLLGNIPMILFTTIFIRAQLANNFGHLVFGIIGLVVLLIIPLIYFYKRK